jgi:regulation of enolase protein 1 (concanavalin A-like superfamily)
MVGLRSSKTLFGPICVHLRSSAVKYRWTLCLCVSVVNSVRFAVSRGFALSQFLSSVLLASFLAPTAQAAALPTGWMARDIGAPSPGGSTKTDGSGPDAVWTVTGTGSDIWNNGDQFQFAYATLTGNGGVTARLLSQSGGSADGWAKTGTMLRESTAAGSRDAYMPYTNGNKFEPSWRVNASTTPTDNNLKQVGRTLEAGPIWIRTQRRGQIFEHLISDDGRRWALMGGQSVAIPANKAILAGLCASMHGGSTPVVAIFDQVSVTDEIVQPTPLGPSPVLATPGDGMVTLSYGAVSDVQGYNIYRRSVDQAPADSVRVNSQPVTTAFFTDTGPGGRGLPNGTNYLYTVRAVYKATAGDLAEGFDSPVVMAEPQEPIPPGFVLYYWNTTHPATATLQRGILSFTASGADIWNIADSGAFLAMPATGDYTLTARVVEQPDVIDPNTSSNVKAGPMIREGIGPSERYAFLFTTSGRGILWEGNRKARNPSADGSGLFSQAGTADGATIYPQWLRLRKANGAITAYQSDDGTSYTPVGDPQSFAAMSPTTYAGLAMSSGNADGYGKVRFDSAGIKIE